jgi:predicted class III extradiol MEMO1 family dioxygenase
MNPKDKNNYYFDSYGVEPPEDVIKWMKKDNKKIVYNTTEIQHIDSTSCGYYCIMFIIWMLRGGDYIDFIHKFEDTGDIHLNNEKVLVGYLNSLL